MNTNNYVFIIKLEKILINCNFLCFINILLFYLKIMQFSQHKHLKNKKILKIQILLFISIKYTLIQTD